MGSSSKKNESSAISSTGSSGGSLLILVDSDCILRILQAMSSSLPATIMSKRSEDTFSAYLLANSDRSTSQGSIPFSRTRLNTALIDSSTGSWSLSPDSARARISMYPPILLSDSSSSASALWNSRCCSSSSMLVFPSISIRLLRGGRLLVLGDLRHVRLHYDLAYPRRRPRDADQVVRHR